MIDFDLEAPGLTLFQDKQLETRRSQEQAGLVDLITDFLDDPWASPVGDGNAHTLFDQYVARLTVPEGVQNENLDGGYLDLIPAGCLSDEYQERIHGLSFNQMFEEGIGKPFFERLKRLIRDSDRYDYVFIDSRTGFSDEGSISTRFLGDYRVVLTGLNNQNVIGTASFLGRTEINDREKLALVASPVPMYYEDLRRERIKNAKEHIGREAGLDDVRFVTQIPFHPILALEEDPTVRDLHDTDLFEAYETLTRTVREWAGDLPEEQIQGALKRLLEGDENARSDIWQIAAEDVSLVLTRLRFATFGFVEKDIEKARQIFDLGISIAEGSSNLEEETQFLAWASSWYSSNGYPIEAKDGYEKLAEIAKKLGHKRGIGASHENLGTVLGWLGAVKHSIDHYNKAQKIWEELDAYSDIVDVNIKIGKLLIISKSKERAVEYLERAVEQSREMDLERKEVYGLSAIGIAYAMVGRHDDAKLQLEQAKKRVHELKSDRAQASFHTDAIEAYAVMEPSEALKQIEENWAFIKEHAHPFDRTRMRVLRAGLTSDTKEAAKDAKEAMEFYQEREVDSVWSREAEEIWERMQDTKKS